MECSPVFLEPVQLAGGKPVLVLDPQLTEGFDGLARHVLAQALHFHPAPHGARSYAGNDEQLGVGVRRKHGADIAPVQYGPRWIGRERALRVALVLTGGFMLAEVIGGFMLVFWLVYFYALRPGRTRSAAANGLVA